MARIRALDNLRGMRSCYSGTSDYIGAIIDISSLCAGVQGFYCKNCNKGILMKIINERVIYLGIEIANFWDYPGKGIFGSRNLKFRNLVNIIELIKMPKYVCNKSYSGLYQLIDNLTKYNLSIKGAA